MRATLAPRATGPQGDRRGRFSRNRACRPEGLDTADLERAAKEAEAGIDPIVRGELDRWPEDVARLTQASSEVAGGAVALRSTTLSGTEVPRVALPRALDDGSLVRFLRGENLPEVVAQ